MIHEKDIVPVGRTRKPYGIRGEIMLLFHKPVYALIWTWIFIFLRWTGYRFPFSWRSLPG